MGVPTSAEPISLDELPKHSDWPKRILGEVDWTVPERNFEKIHEEYEEDKYQKLLNFVKETESRDPWTVKRRQNSNREWQILENLPEEDPVCISQSNRLYTAPIHDAQRGNDRAVVEAFRDVLSGHETVVELGSGYGYNLHVLSEAYPDCTFLGGDVTENAIEIASHLYEDRPNISVEPFNYYDDTWDILEGSFENEVVVFSRLSIEQLPSCRSVLQTLLNYSDAFREVVHLEPVYGLHDEDSLLQLLRKKYIEINDYNRDLLEELQRINEASVTSTEYDVYGFNGLNPMSLVRWQPN